MPSGLLVDVSFLLRKFRPMKEQENCIGRLKADPKPFALGGKLVTNYGSQTASDLVREMYQCCIWFLEVMKLAASLTVYFHVFHADASLLCTADSAALLVTLPTALVNAQWAVQADKAALITELPLCAAAWASAVRCQLWEVCQSIQRSHDRRRLLLVNLCKACRCQRSIHLTMTVHRYNCQL